MDDAIKAIAAVYPPLITLQQAAEISQFPLDTIYDWSHRQLLDEFKTRRGRQVRLGRDAFVKFLFTEPTQSEI